MSDLILSIVSNRTFFVIGTEGVKISVSIGKNLL